jgi:hypothetical protein
LIRALRWLESKFSGAATVGSFGASPQRLPDRGCYRFIAIGSPPPQRTELAGPSIICRFACKRGADLAATANYDERWPRNGDGTHR